MWVWLTGTLRFRVIGCGCGLLILSGLEHGCFIPILRVAYADVTEYGARRQKCLATALDNNGYRVSR